MSWNSRSIKCVYTKTDVVNFLQKNNCDVFAIQETFLKSCDRIYVPNFKMFRADRDSPHGGGLCVFVHKKFKCERIKIGEFKCFEVLSLKMFVDNSSLVLNNVYMPRYNRHFGDELNVLCTQNNHISIGDFNAIHNSWSNGNENAAGIKLFDRLPINNSVLYSPPAPTHFARGRSDTTIDLVITNSAWYTNDITNDFNFLSDHCAIKCTLNMPVHIEPIRYNLDFANANWVVFRDELKNDLPDLLVEAENCETNDHIDNVLNKLIDCIKLAQNKAVPLKLCKENDVPLSDQTKKLLWWKRKLNRKISRCVTDVNTQHYRSLLARTVQLLKHSTNVDRNNNWTDAILKANGNNKMFWRLAKCLRKAKCNSGSYVDEVNKVVLETDEEAAEAFASQFLSNHNTFTITDANNAYDTRCNNNYNRIKNKSVDANTIDTIDADELLSHITSLKNKKSMGIDGISTKAIKNLPIESIDLLTVLFNKCLSRALWPVAFKRATVVPVPKGKMSKNIKNYRPISLLTVLSKVLEKCILRRLKAHVHNKNVLPNHQFGFREAHCSVLQAANRIY